MTAKTFDQLLQIAKTGDPYTMAVACAADREVLRAVEDARRGGIANSILVGNREEIWCIAEREEIELAAYLVLDAKDKAEACALAVEQVRTGGVQLLMKGFVDTPVLLKAVLDKENGIKSGGLISHVSVFEALGRLMLLSDSAMNIAPNLEEKIEIIHNMARMAQAIGIKMPNIAAVCAVEKVSPKMPATQDAEALTALYKEGAFPECRVWGPMALDNAVSGEAALHKGVVNPVAGQADGLLMPNIEAGNVLIKSLEYFAQAKKAGVVLGAKVPIVLTSRASSDQAKLYSIVLGVLAARQGGAL